MLYPESKGSTQLGGAPCPSPESWKSLKGRRKKCEHAFQGHPHPLPLGLVPTDCHKSCQTCSSPGTCVTCQEGLLVNHHGDCVPHKECAPSEYWDVEALGCKPCHAKCFRCTGPAEDQCHACLRDHLLLSESRVLWGGLSPPLHLGNYLPYHLAPSRCLVSF